MRYRVELDELLAFVDKLQSFERRAEAIAARVDRQVADLHTTWSGEDRSTYQLEAHQKQYAIGRRKRQEEGKRVMATVESSANDKVQAQSTQHSQAERARG